MSRNYLVTGGAGFIGSNYVRRLLERGENIAVRSILIDTLSGRCIGLDGNVRTGHSQSHIAALHTGGVCDIRHFTVQRSRINVNLRRDHCCGPEGRHAFPCTA